MKHFATRALLFALLFAALFPAVRTTAGEDCDCDLAACLVALVEDHRQRGWVGASLAWGRGGDGLLVVELFADGPAERAGLERGDTVVALDGAPFSEDTPEEMNARWRAVRPGQTVTLTVRSQQGERRDVRLRTTEFPAEQLERSIGRYVLSLVHERTAHPHRSFHNSAPGGG